MPSLDSPQWRSPPGRARVLHVVCLGLLSWVCFAYRVGEPTLWRSQEARVAWIVRAMLRSGDLVTPRGPKGIVFDDKPPMYHWLAALMSLPRESASASPRSLRAPSVVSGVAVVLLVYAWGSSCWGSGAGLAAGVVLATAVKFLGDARAARVDILLTFWLTAMLAAAWWALAAGPRRRPAALLALYGAAAAATLTKGPVLALLPLAPLVLLLALRRDLRALGRLRPLAGIAIVFLLCGWWFVAVHLSSAGDFTYGFFVNHHWRRYVGGETGGHFKAGPIYGYVPALLGGTLPWPALVVAAVVTAGGDWRRGRRASRDPTALLLLWVVALVVLFSLGRVKRADYIVPAFPALALLVGRMAFGPTAGRPMTTSRRSRFRGWTTRMFGLQAVVAAALYVALCAVVFGGAGEAFLRWAGGRWSLTDRLMVDRYLALLVERRWLTWAAGMALMVGAAASWVAARAGRLRAAFLLTGGATAVLVGFYTTSVLPEAEPLRGSAGLARVIRREMQSEDLVIYVDDAALELSYYVDRPAEWALRPNGLSPEDIRLWTGGGRGRCFVVMEERYYRRLVAPRERLLGLSVVAASIPEHVRPVVVLSNR